MSRLITVLSFGFICLVSAPVAAQGEAPVPLLSVPHIEGVVEALGVKYPPPPEESSANNSRGAAVWAYSELRPGAKMVQLKISDITYDADDFFQIEIINHSGAVLQTLTAESIGVSTSVWTDLSVGQSIGLYVYGNRKGSLSFTIEQISFDREGRTLESVVGTDDREHLYKYNGDFLDVAERARGSVAKLSFLVKRQQGTVRETCTGFLIDNDLLMTNQHCVADQERCDTTKVIFGYAYDQAGRIPGMEQYSCTKVESVDDDHDMALLRIEGKPGLRWGTLAFSPTAPKSGQAVFILQHPAGEAKQISALGCEVAEAISPGRAEQTDFSHRCDTLGGSSGSPVIDKNGDVVGLHHWGRTSFGTYSQVNRAVRAEKIVPIITSFLPTTSNEPEASDPETTPIPENSNSMNNETEGASTAAPTEGN
ncbi:trypsin-like serine peptidase [Lentilitoribacter sp. EG35]|uniref:trypsin-like serine peptidase n=1 Tax=Lentilitoribacter sp. EG35 TaxID=3234192 RepID=UPI00345FCB77